MVQAARAQRVSDAEAARRMSFSAAALGVAGHEITDPYLLEVAELHAREEISGEEARRLSLKHVLGR